MLVSFIRYARGFVGFRVIGRTPERFLNLCAQRGIRLWNSQPSPQGLQARMFVSDYKAVRPVARRAGVRTQVLKKRGLPFFVARYRGRAGLPVGAALGAVLLLTLSQFVWNITVTGNETVSEQRITALLAESGVRIGAYTKGIDTGQAKRDILLKTEEIGWVSVNLHGSRATVEVREKVKKPELEEKDTPCNIKASADGVITKITAKNGEAQVKVGSGVAKGDLLVSGVSVTKQNTVRCLRAKADVWADVYTEKQLSLPKYCVYDSLTENRSFRRRLSFLGLEVPCSLSFVSFPNAAYTCGSAEAYLNGTALPLGVVTETARELRRETFADTQDRARQVFDNALLLYEVFERGRGRVTKKQVTLSETAEGFTCACSYVFNENIAESVDFSAEE